MAGTVQWTTSGSTLIDGVTISAGTVDTNGTANGIILDADGDTTIDGATANTITYRIGGADDFTMTANTFNVLSGSTIAGPTSTFGTFIPITAQEAVSDSAGIGITAWYTAWTTTGAATSGLSDGVVQGHMKKITLIVDGGNGVLTPDNLAGGTTITFADAGDFAILYFDGTNWVPIELGNDADGATLPALA